MTGFSALTGTAAAAGAAAPIEFLTATGAYELVEGSSFVQHTIPLTLADFSGNALSIDAGDVLVAEAGLYTLDAFGQWSNDAPPTLLEVGWWDATGVIASIVRDTRMKPANGPAGSTSNPNRDVPLDAGTRLRLRCIENGGVGFRVDVKATVTKLGERPALIVL
jgi:hypothetical protein